MKPLQHAQISANTYGGKWQDYIEIHCFLDSSKATCAHFKHRFLLHHREGIELGVRIFGACIRNSENETIETRRLLTDHLIEDVGRVVGIEDWARDLLPDPSDSFYKFLAKKRSQIGTDQIPGENELLTAFNLSDKDRTTYALSFVIATRASSDTAVELLELVNRFDEQTGERFAALPMRDLQTMAGSLLLDKIWKAGWKVENEQAFWRYNEKRENASANQNVSKTKETQNAAATTAAATA